MLNQDIQVKEGEALRTLTMIVKEAAGRSPLKQSKTFARRAAV